MRSSTVLNQQVYFASIMDALNQGHEVRLTYNGHQFSLIRYDHLIVVTVEDEVCNFNGCTEREIKDECMAWYPGAWR
jgi:hypothetical protein